MFALFFFAIHALKATSRQRPFFFVNTSSYAEVGGYGVHLKI